MHLTFITTAGTIFQRLDPATGQMVIGASLADILSPEWLNHTGIASWDTVDLSVRSGAELTYDTIFAARDAVVDRRGRSAGFVLVTGTDTLEEFAFCLDLLLAAEVLLPTKAALVVTGAMKPYDIEGYDGRANLRQAVQVASSPQAARYGVLAVLNDSVHLARFVAKADSQLMGAFVSTQPGGPVGQVREGRVRFYYGPPPDSDTNDSYGLTSAPDPATSTSTPPDTTQAANTTSNTTRVTAIANNSTDNTSSDSTTKNSGPSSSTPSQATTGGSLCLRDCRFASLTADRVNACCRVAIWVTGVSAFLPESLLSTDPRVICGLVVAAPGTGSLSAALTDQLAAHTARLPVVLVSRCPRGNNYDDWYYRGSRAKYERQGFLLAGYEHVNAVQARHLLVFRLAAGVYPQFQGPGGGAAGG